MSSVNSPRPPQPPAPTTGSTGPAQAPVAPKTGGSPTTQSGRDQFDPAQSGSQFQSSINQEILPNNGGEQVSGAHSKAHQGKKADEAQDPNDPSTQPNVTPKA